MTVMDFLLPTSLGGLRKGFLTMINPSARGFRAITHVQLYYELHMDWWLSNQQNIQRTFVLDLDSPVYAPVGGTWLTPVPFEANLRCTKANDASFREVNVVNGVLRLNTSGETYLFFDMGPASSSAVTAKLDYSSLTYFFRAIIACLHL
jgi:hypothetical protein